MRFMYLSNNIIEKAFNFKVKRSFFIYFNKTAQFDKSEVI